MRCALYFLALVTIASGQNLSVKFFLTTPEKPKLRTLFDSNNYTRLMFHRSRKYKVLLHGYTNDENAFWYNKTITEYMKRGSSNVITVGMGSAMQKLIYMESVWKVRTLGEIVGSMLSVLHKNKGIGNIHLIGHSLGAHVAGIAGNTFYAKTGRKIARISALDPALPGFLFSNESRIVSEDDANCVDVYHSSILGINRKIGGVDFYLNGGLVQPGCAFDIVCSHSVVTTLFQKSINNKKLFVGRKCKDYDSFQSGACKNNEQAYMGEHLSTKTKGEFYVITNSAFGVEQILSELRMAF